MNWCFGGVANKTKGAKGIIMLVLWIMARQPHERGKTQLGMLVPSLSEFGHPYIAFKFPFSISLYIVNVFCLKLLWICQPIILQMGHKWPWFFRFL
jgi:hypothetical protein